MATIDHSAEVLDLLHEAAAWLHEQGITDQWPLRTRPALGYVRRRTRRGTLSVGGSGKGLR
ncbi:MAG TPA: hypothetical protein VHX38_22345 [Pseudonocardiaceae bacterium]|nr:hypothetical protein [Pseudonocardiaceae bacterium]